MTDPLKFLLLVGSPRARKSASQSLASHLSEQLTSQGAEVDIRCVLRPQASNEQKAELRAALDDSDRVLFVFPLYADQVPSLLLEFMEDYADHAATNRAPLKKGLAAVVNCGFPEARHNDTAIAVIRLFAKAQDFKWLGGLAIGGGGVIPPGKPLAPLGGRVRNLVQALNLSAEALAKGAPLPEEAMALVRKPSFPDGMYRFMANLGWVGEAFSAKVLLRLKDKPYAD
jgi:hypothetical protein